MSQSLLAVKQMRLVTAAMFCSHMIALSNQMPAFNDSHKHIHRLEKIKYIGGHIKDILYNCILYIHCAKYFMY